MINAIPIVLIIQSTFRTSTAGPSHEYQVFVGSESWQKADEMCVEFNMDSLAAIFIEEEDEDYEALKQAKKGRPPNKNQKRINDGVPFWVGLYRNNSDPFAWIDGTPCEDDAGDFCVKDWLEEPDLSVEAEYCVTLTVNSGDESRGYKTESCETEMRYLCSYIHTTTTTALPEATPAPNEPALPGEGIPSPTSAPSTYEPTTGIPTTGTPTTSAPTSSPTRRVCTEEGYEIEGSTCWATGDPHFSTWSGARHDYMGNPALDAEFFYYVAPCHDATVQDLPFTLIGNHYKWGSSGVTVLHYVTLELFKDSYGSQNQYDKYYLWMSSSIQAYMDATDDNPSYDDHINDEGLVTLAAGDYRAIGDDGKFQVKYIKSGSYIQVWLKIDDVPQVYFRMYGWGYISGRYRGHNFYLDVPTNYRCFICGLCGDFQRARNGGAHDQQTLITCKGGLESYQWGWWNGHPSWEFAYDLDGNTYEYHYFNDECPLHDRDTTARRLTAEEDQVYIPHVGDDFVYVDPYEACSTILEQVNATCAAAKAASSDDCDFIGDDFCDDLQEDCVLDVCVFSENDASMIDANVEIAFYMPLRDEVTEVRLHASAANEDAFIGANHQTDDNYKHPQNDYEYNYNDYKPDEYPNNPDVVAIKSTWIFYGGLLLSILLIINFVYMCYLNTSQREKRGYVTVKYSESEYDDSEVSVINQPQI